jgi:hypothetical protein
MFAPVRAVLVLPALAVAAIWAVALAHWPDLPARFPVHFDLAGRPDSWWPRSASGWFLLPALASVIVLGFGYALPAWMLRLARADSPYLNVPHREAFGRLTPELRARALTPVTAFLRVVAAELALLFGAIVHGSAEIAAGARERLPEALVWSALALILVTGLVSALIGRRAIERVIGAR